MKDKSKILGPEFNGLLNSQNKSLWEYLNQKYDLRLEESPEEGYMTYIDTNCIVIEVDMRDLNPSGFTHELLHVYMKDQGIHVNRDLKSAISSDWDLQEIFSTSLRVHLGNCLEHVKMLPIYLDLGFRNELFIGDYDTKIIDEVQIQILEEQYYQDAKPVMKSVDCYLGKFYSMKASNNPTFDYSLYYERFERIDSTLYAIQERFWKRWLDLELDPGVGYTGFLELYLSEMKDWKKDFEESRQGF